MRTESSKRPNMPILPVLFKTYQGLVFNQEYIQSVENEVSISTLEMTEDLFLALCAISSADDAKHYLTEHPGHRFFTDINRLIPPGKYYEHVFQLVNGIKATYGLWQLYAANEGKNEDAYIDVVASYVVAHREGLKGIISDYRIKTAEQYKSDGYESDTYELLASSLSLIDNEITSLVDSLKEQYLLLDPCDTVIDAMWKYGYKRIFINCVEYRQCKKAGCKECFSVGPGGQTGRKYCKNHQK